MEDTGNIESIIQYEEPIPMKDIMKVCILNDSNTIQKMVVFQGSMRPVGRDDDIFSEYEQLQNVSADFDIQSSSMQLQKKKFYMNLTCRYYRITSCICFLKKLSQSIYINYIWKLLRMKLYR